MITEAVVFLRDEVRRYLLEDGAITAATEVVLETLPLRKIIPHWETDSFSA